MCARPHASRFEKVRRDHSTETAEDYLEAVCEITEKHGRCRVTDLARLMGVTHVTVTRIISRLDEEGLVVRRPYHPIKLTEKGRQVAARSRRRHEIVLEFLLALGVPPADAQRDAEGIEHHVGDSTLKEMASFVRNGDT